MSNRIVLISSTAAHGVLRHGHLPGFLRGGVAGLPYSAHQNQAQAEEKSGDLTWKSLNAAHVLVFVKHACDGGGQRQKPLTDCSCVLTKWRPALAHGSARALN